MHILEHSETSEAPEIKVVYGRGQLMQPSQSVELVAYFPGRQGRQPFSGSPQFIP